MDQVLNQKIVNFVKLAGMVGEFALQNQKKSAADSAAVAEKVNANFEIIKAASLVEPDELDQAKAALGTHTGALDMLNGALGLLKKSEAARQQTAELLNEKPAQKKKASSTEDAFVGAVRPMSERASSAVLREALGLS